MKRVTFFSALFGAVVMFLALGSTKAQAFGTCEDRIFHSGVVVGYRCEEQDQDEDTPVSMCTYLHENVDPLSFIWSLDEELLYCQCRKTWAGFETDPYEFLCTGYEEEDDETMGLAAKILWKNGPIRAEGVEVVIGGSSGAGFVLKCKPDPSCVPSG